jgi:hypothetical protein
MGLHVSRINFDNLKEKVESLSKALEGTKATKQLSTERGSKGQ